jgi:hypothetical protein
MEVEVILMKKFLVSVCMVLLITSIVTGSLAFDLVSDKWFTINDVQCVNTTALKYWDFNNDPNADPGFNYVPYKEIDSNSEGRIYVYHNVINGGSNSYTNLFHAVKFYNPSYNDTMSP